MDILRLLPADQYDAAVNANAPTAANPFATIADLTGGDGNGIYDGSGIVPANTEVTLTNDLMFLGGNIGIAPDGTTFAPTNPLEINMPEETTGGIRIMEAGADKAKLFFNADEGGVLELRQHNAGTLRTRISGDVGGTSYFNTANSSGVFAVNGANASNALAPIDIRMGNPANASVIFNNTAFFSSATGTGTLKIMGTGGQARIEMVGRSQPQNYRFYTFETVNTAGNGFLVLRGWNDNDAAGRNVAKTTTRHNFVRFDDVAVTFNTSAADVNFVVQGDTDLQLLHCDAGLDLVGIGLVPTNSKLEVDGNVETVGSGNGYVAQADNGNRVLMQLVEVSPGNYAWDSGTEL